MLQAIIGTFRTPGILIGLANDVRNKLSLGNTFYNKLLAQIINDYLKNGKRVKGKGKSILFFIDARGLIDWILVTCGTKKILHQNLSGNWFGIA
ncbi:hypothetical protein ACLFKQ_12460 [Myxosarcina sp. GI1(2024)]